MLFLELKSSDTERLSKLVTEKGMDVEGLARLAFLKGLKLLMKDDGKTNNSHVRNARLQEVLSRQKRRDQLDALIRTHSETKDDYEIGRLMEPPVSYTTVHRHRLKLGLKGKTERTGDQKIRELIDPEEFNQMVSWDGYTMTEYLRVKNLHCTKQHLAHVANELGLKHSPLDRAPEWSLKRKARKLANLNLANREWLAEMVAKSVSMTNLAAELGIDEQNLRFFVRRFELIHPSLRRYGAETVDLVCANCQVPFKRLKKFADARFKKSKGKDIKFYCSVSCGGKYKRVKVQQEHAAV